MRKSTLVFLAIILAASACRKNGTTASTLRSSTRTTAVAVKDERNAKVNKLIDPAIPKFIDKNAIGDQLGPDGTVTGELTTFRAGEPVYVTMRFKQSPAGLQSSVHVLDESRKQVYTEAKPMKGAKVVTFKLPPLKPGHYEVSGYWGGNVAAEYQVNVERKTKRDRVKK